MVFFSSQGHVDKEYCHVFDFMLGILFYDVPFINDEKTTARLSDIALLDLVLQYPDYSVLNSAAYNISYATSTYGWYLDADWRKEAFQFCKSSIFPNISCSLFLFNAYDELSTIATDYYYPLRRGACNNSFTIADWYVADIFSWDKGFREDLVHNPPTDLIQEYYVCTNSV